MVKLSDNQLYRIAEQVGEYAKEAVSPMAEKMRGGSLPPGKLDKPKALALEEYLLVSAPRVTLQPDEQVRADELWTDIYSKQDEVTLKKWAMAMEAERLKAIKPQGVNNAQQP